MPTCSAGCHDHWQGFARNSQKWGESMKKKICSEVEQFASILICWLRTKRNDPDFFSPLKKPVLPFFSILVLAAVISSAPCCKAAATEKAEKRQLSIQFVGDIGYKCGDNLSAYENERCRLDLYLPEGKKGFPVIVWFHGGSLQRLSKDDAATKALARRFAQEGVAVAVANYRLSPQVHYPVYIQDAAAAVAWVKENISSYSGNPRAVFICGHSAGGYLSLMLALDPAYLQNQEVDRLAIAGIVSIGGQTFTHYAIREERGMANAETTPVLDEAAPCFHARKDTPPILIVWSDGDSPDRIAENMYLEAILRRVGNDRVSTMEARERNHWTLVTRIPEPDDPLAAAVLDFIHRNSKSTK
jgi:acetyl esterase/lipase